MFEWRFALGNEKYHLYMKWYTHDVAVNLLKCVNRRVLGLETFAKTKHTHVML